MNRYALLLALLISTASADDRPYVRWLIVAYFEGIDKQPTAVTRPFKTQTDCGDNIESERKRLRIPVKIVIGCQQKQYNTGGKL
jgi:hypothetical protein